jgi:hypothetical protein
MKEVFGFMSKSSLLPSDEELNEKRFRVEIEGVTPILMNRFVGQNLNTKRMSEEEIAEIHCYRNEKGNLYIPREWIIGMILNAASYSVSKQRKEAVSWIARRIWVEEEQIDLGIKNYDIDRRVVFVSSKSSFTCGICVRPKINKWKATFHIRTILSKDYLLYLLKYGGREIGLGSNRKHGFGQFKVTSIVEEKV